MQGLASIANFSAQPGKPLLPTPVKARPLLVMVSLERPDDQ
jgi:hypothetical protein